MIILLTPSKTMDFGTPAPEYVKATTPLFLSEAERIASHIASLSRHVLEEVMHVSPVLADGVHKKYAAWGGAEAHKKPALWAYKGDVYKGMKANELSREASAWAGDKLYIMSGLYGLLRPTDVISPYRLEMKAPLTIGKTVGLYDYWGSLLGIYLEKHADGLIINVCSDEYSKAALRHVSKSTRVITPVFFDTKPSGKIGTVPIYSKMMRGVFARWMIDNRIEVAGDVHSFKCHEATRILMVV